MKDVSGNEGRTILLVSHQINSIRSLCNHAILLENGLIRNIDKAEIVIEKYLSSSKKDDDYSWENNSDSFSNEYFTCKSIRIVLKENKKTAFFKNDESITIEIEGFIKKYHKSLVIGIALYDQFSNLLFWSLHDDEGGDLELETGSISLSLMLPKNLLNEGKYRIELIAALHFLEWIYEPEKNSPIIHFIISGGLSNSANWINARPGILAPIVSYKKII